MNFIIQDAESITCMTELLEHCDVTCQAEVWSMFTAILRKSVRNLQTSTEVGLIEQVLLKMSTVDDMIAGMRPSGRALGVLNGDLCAAFDSLWVVQWCLGTHRPRNSLASELIKPRTPHMLTRKSVSALGT